MTIKIKTAFVAAVAFALVTPLSILNAQTQPGFCLAKVAEGIPAPWGMTWLPDGDLLVTGRNGKLLRVRNGALIKICGVPQVHVNGQGEGNHTPIRRAKLQNNTLVAKEVLYKGEENSTRGQHYDSRIAFDEEGYLYFSIGATEALASCASCPSDIVWFLNI